MPGTAAKMILLRPHSAGVIYLLRDEFTTDAAAPLTSPRAAEPGPGSLTLVQVDGQFSISSGVLQIPAQVSAAWGDQGFYGPSMARVAGRALISKRLVTTTAGVASGIGWSTAANANITNVIHSAYLDGTGRIRPLSPAETILVAGYSGGVEYQFAIVLRSAGAFNFVKGGAFASWTLIFVAVSSTVTPLFPTFFNFNHVGTMDYFRVADLSGAFATDDGIATVNVNTPVSGVSQTATADGIHDFVFALPGVPVAGDKIELRYNVLDASNYNTAYVTYTGAAWDFAMDTVVAGVATNRIGAAGVGTPTMLRVIHEGNLHDCYTLAGAAWTKRGAQVNNSNQAAVTAISATFNAGTSVSLRSYPRTSSAYDVLDQV